MQHLNLSTLTENRKVNKKISGIIPVANSATAFEKVNVIIDFTTPKSTLEILKIAKNLKKRVVIGTTGFDRKRRI